MSPESILDTLPIDRSAKAAAWDAVQSAKSPDELQSAMDELPLPKRAKAALWDVKSKMWEAQPDMHFSAPVADAPSMPDAPTPTTLPDAAPPLPPQNGQELPPAPPQDAQQAPMPDDSAPSVNQPEFIKAHNAWNDATNKAALDHMQKFGTTHEDAKSAVAGTVGLEPKIDNYKAPLEPPPPPEAPPAPPELPKPTHVQSVSAATPNPPTAAMPTQPESPETIAAQVQQLGQFGAPVTPSQRKAVMFPGGNGMPPLSTLAGLKITHDHFGNVYAYRPDLLTPGEIHSAAKQNRLTELLGGPIGMGAPDKSALQGTPVAVVARAPDGTEIQSTATDVVNLPKTHAATAMVTPPGGSLSVEPIPNILAQRRGIAPPPAPAPPQIPVPPKYTIQQIRRAAIAKGRHPDLAVRQARMRGLI